MIIEDDGIPGCVVVTVQDYTKTYSRKIDSYES